MHFFDEHLYRRQAEERAKKERELDQAFAEAIKSEISEFSPSELTGIHPSYVPGILATEEQERRRRLGELHRRMFPDNYDLSELW